MIFARREVRNSRMSLLASTTPTVGVLPKPEGGPTSTPLDTVSLIAAARGFIEDGSGRTRRAIERTSAMRAALFNGPKDITVGERPDPRIENPTDAVVRVVMA